MELIIKVKGLIHHNNTINLVATLQQYEDVACGLKLKLVFTNWQPSICLNVPSNNVSQ